MAHTITLRAQGATRASDARLSSWPHRALPCISCRRVFRRRSTREDLQLRKFADGSNAAKIESGMPREIFDAGWKVGKQRRGLEWPVLGESSILSKRLSFLRSRIGRGHRRPLAGGICGCGASSCALSSCSLLGGGSEVLDPVSAFFFGGVEARVGLIQQGFDFALSLAGGD